MGIWKKTSKRWIVDDQDLEAMYRNLNSGSEITIWCEGQSHEQPSSESSSKNSHKRKAPESDDAPPTKRTDKMALELHEKHGEVYAMPHLRIWARMILNKQHKSMDVPPPFPLFKDHTPKHPPKRYNLTDALTSVATAVVGMIKGNNESSGTLSPGKRARVSGQYLEHLERLKSLHESGVLRIWGAKEVCTKQHQET